MSCEDVSKGICFPSPRFGPSRHPAGCGDDYVVLYRHGMWRELPGGCRDDSNEGFLAGGLPELPADAGTTRGGHRQQQRGRATPAGAGTTRSPETRHRRTASNPRERGDDWLGTDILVSDDELPPRARGPRWRPACRACARRATPRARGPPPDSSRGRGPPRATPAGAGTTVQLGYALLGGGSYPRGRGDHTARPAVPCTASELPPRARGPRGVRSPEPWRCRATPAGAGTTPFRQAPPSAVESYPRGRGDHGVTVAVTVSVVELPPRARGPPRPRRQSEAAAGATPAGAGTTPRTGRRSAGCRSYPRGRGDHTS